MVTSTVTTERREFVPRERLLRAGLAATAAALLAVLVARLLVGALYVIDPSLGPFQWLPLVASTVVAGVGATLVYAALDRYTARPGRNFLAVSAVVFVGMLVPVLTVAPSLGVAGDLQAVLVALHAAVAVPIVAVLYRLPGSTSA
jgi:hypothetical protein